MGMPDKKESYPEQVSAPRTETGLWKQGTLLQDPGDVAPRFLGVAAPSGR